MARIAGVDLPVKKGRVENSRLLRRCLLVEGMDALIKAQAPALSSTRMDLL